jgi:hypothetical protein
MTLRLTPKQYKTLIKMAWIASRVSQGSEQQESDTVEQILQLTDHLCTAAADFGANDLFETVESQTDSGPAFSVGNPPPLTVRLKPELEDELLSIIEWFEEFSFWDILEDRLAMRDISEERTEAQWNWLPDAEKDRIYDKYQNYYFEEFSEAGIGNLRLVQPEPGKPRVPLGWGDGNADSGSDVGPSLATPGSHDPASPGRRPAKIIEFPGGGPGSPRGPDGKPPKKPRE